MNGISTQTKRDIAAILASLLIFAVVTGVAHVIDLGTVVEVALGVGSALTAFGLFLLSGRKSRP